MHRGEEGCSELPGGGGGGRGSRGEARRAEPRGAPRLLPPRGPGGGGGAPRSVRGGPRCPMAPRRVCSCAALSEHVPGGRTCALGPRPSGTPGRRPPGRAEGERPAPVPGQAPPSGLEPAAPGAAPRPARGPLRERARAQARPPVWAPLRGRRHRQPARAFSARQRCFWGDSSQKCSPWHAGGVGVD